MSILQVIPPQRPPLSLVAEALAPEAVVQSLAELVTSGDAGALRWLEDKVDRLPQAVAELAARVSVTDLEDRLAELRERMRQAQEDLERASYRADVVEVQATLLAAEDPASRSGRTSRAPRKGRDRTQVEGRRLEDEAAELRALAARRERELRQDEEEHALLLALAAARTAVGSS